jgi:hypothetical protein
LKRKGGDLKKILAALWLGIFVIYFAHPICAQAPVSLKLLVLPTDNACWPVESAAAALKSKYGEDLNLDVCFLVEPNAAGAVSSPMGEDDFSEVKRQAFLRRRYPEKFWSYLQARNSEMYSPIWQHAALWSGVDLKALTAAGNSTPAAAYWAQDEALAKKYQVQKTPAIIINGEKFSEGEIGLPQMDAAVRACLGKKHETYSLTVVFDPNAPQPRKSEAEAYLKKFIPGVAFEEMPSTLDLEKSLTNTGVKTLPAILADKTFLGSYYGSFFSLTPAARVRADQYAVPVPVLPESLLGRDLQKGTVQIVMQSQCPYAADLLRQLLEKKKSQQWPGTLQFPLFILDAEYVRNLQPQGAQLSLDTGHYKFSSLHGEGELEEDARQLALQKYYPEQYWAYVESLYTQKDATWEKALTSAGVEKTVLQKHWDGERDKLLLENFEKLSGIAIAQSPVVIADNRYVVTEINEFFKQTGLQIKGQCGH